MTGQYVRHISCHCQKHVLRLTLPAGTPFDDFGVCDCSHCLKRRIVWHMAPENTMEIIRGFGTDGVDIQSYEFGGKHASHQVCVECGTHLLGDKFDPTKKTMWNMRAIRDADFIGKLWELPLNLYSGLDRKPDYVWPTLADIPGAENYLNAIARDIPYPTQIYVGSCHCQAIKFAVLSKPLEDAKLDDCACSICLGNGDLWLRVPRDRRSVYFHPHASDTETYIPPWDLINEYGFAQRRNLHYICKHCGIQIYEYKIRPFDDPRPENAAPNVIAEHKPWEQENGWNGGYGFNAMLLNDIGEYLRDVQGLAEDRVGGKGTKRLKGLTRELADALDEPLYALKL